jgi:hypothetical protein
MISSVFVYIAKIQLEVEKSLVVENKKTPVK